MTDLWHCRRAHGANFEMCIRDRYTDGGSYKDVGQKITDAGNGWKKFEASGRCV